LWLEYRKTKRKNKFANLQPPKAVKQAEKKAAMAAFLVV
jgi:hypothetical protein